MWLHLLLLLFGLFSALHAEWDQLFSDEEDPSLYHHVNVITGNLNLCMEDGVIEGAKSLPIFRTYSSAGALESFDLNADLKIERKSWVVQGGWNFLPHTNLWIDLSSKVESFKIYLAEPSGNLVSYAHSHQKSDHTHIFKPGKEFAQHSSALSAKHAIGNHILELNIKNGTALLLLPDGGSREYKGHTLRHWDKHRWSALQNEQRSKYYYRLMKEVLPSRHEVHYTYSNDHRRHLVDVAVKNPSGLKTFAWMHIDLIDKSPFVLGIRTSDKKTLRYKTMHFKGVDYICGAECSHKPEERLGFGEGRYGIGARLDCMTLANKLQFYAKYYAPSDKTQAKKWRDKPSKKTFEGDKVGLLEIPIGPAGELLALAHFSYQPGKTEVRDNGDRLTRYYHTDGHLTSIEHCNEKDEAVSTIKFLWEEGRLKAKVMLDAQGNAQFSKVFQYDNAGNVTQETLWGVLTGDVEGPFRPNDDGSLEGAEHYSKKYAYLPQFNIPILEEEEKGLTYRYTYKQDTDLLTAKLTCCDDQILLREFFIYDEDNLLIAEMTDDGDSPNSTDLHDITERHIKRYQRNPSSGQIDATTETYVDAATQTEQQLKKVTYSYSPEKRVIAEAIADADDVHRYTITTDYDAHGHVIRKTTPLGQENCYAYDNLGNLLTAKEVGSLKKTFHYDAAGKPASVEESDALGVVKTSSTVYDTQGNLLSQTDAKGNTTEQCYDAFGRCVRTYFPPASDQNGTPYRPTTTFEYDIQGNLTSTSVLEGETTHTTYNTLRKPIRILRADGTALHHRYSKDGTLVQTIQPDGTHTEYLYDCFQRMISKKTYSSEEELLSAESWAYNAFHLLTHTDPNGLTTYYTYDQAGRKVRQQAETNVITYEYDTLGFLEKTTEAELTHVQLHDVEGKVIEEWEEPSDGHIENQMWFTYDDENRKIKAIRTTSVGEATDLFFYDRESRLTTHTDPLNNTTQFHYGETENALGQRVLQKTIIDPLGNCTIETQDAQNRLVTRTKTNPQGNTVAQETLFYDKAGNQARRVSTIYHGQIAQSPITVHWEYDLMGRLITESEGQDKTTHFTYDVKGRLRQRLQPNGITLNYTYDGLDRLTEMKSSDATIHYEYTYASGPDPTEVIDHIHRTRLKRAYNTFGQIIKEVNPYGLTCTWTYDQHSRPTSYTLPDHSSITYHYTASHLAEIARFTPTGALLYTHRYCAYNPNGQVAQEECIHSGMRHTTYDLLERPTHVQHASFKQSISYGPSSLVTSTENTLFGTKTYAHDPLNQLIQEAEERYTFDSLGNPLDCSVNKYNQIVNGLGYRFEYDPNGNPTRRTTAEGITHYKYDALNRLISITHPNAQHTHFTYDAFSRLIATDKRLYIYDKSHEIGALDETGTLIELKVLNLEEHPSAIAIELSTRAYAPITDFQGNTIALLSSQHKIIEAYTIDSFGKESYETPPRNPWRFASKRTLDGLIYFGQRFYVPQLKRWLTPDPSGFADGPNLYTYVLNSPLNRLDLFGLHSDPFSPRPIQIDIPLSALIPAAIFRTSGLIPCKGFVDNVPVNWVVSCGHWNKLQFTPDEWMKGTVNIANHFHELVPTQGRTIGLITNQNGIQTNHRGLEKSMHSITQMVPEGTLTIGLHNPTQGFFKDLRRTFRERKGRDTPTVVRTRQFLVAVSDTLHKINPDLLWLHIPHSEAGLIQHNAFKGMTPDQQRQLRGQLLTLALGSARPMPWDYGFEIQNVYSKQDFVTGGFALKYRNDPRYDIKFVRCRSSWSERTGYVADHARLGGTYQNVQSEYLEEKRGKWKFYDGKKH